MRVVLDTVVFVRALINARGQWARLIDLADNYTLVVSPEIVHEILSVLNRPTLRGSAGQPRSGGRQIHRMRY